MLDALRRGATGFLAKLMLGLLVLSFAIWGIADVFRGFRAGSLARVGSHDISADEFQRAYQDEVAALSQQFGRRLTPEQARAFGIDQRVLSRLVGSTAIDEHAAELKLGISDRAMVASVQADPTFKGTDGKFDRTRFDQLLRQAGLSERGYFFQRRQDELRSQLTGTLLAGITPPPAMIDALHAWQEETRTIAYFTIDPAKTVKIGEPDEAALKKTYDDNQRQLMAPEMRKLAVLMLTGEAIKTRAAVTDAEVKALWEEDRTSFDIPERRRLQQVTFKTLAEAKEAAKAIAGGKSFFMVALEANVHGRVDEGLLARRDIPDPKLAAQIFALKLNELSEPIETRGGVELVRVTQIEPGKKRTFEEVAKEVRATLEARKLSENSTKLHDEVDDMRGAGKTLKEIAEAKKLKLVEMPAVDRTGKGPDGKPAADLGADAQAILARGFEGAVGVENETVDLADGGFAWVEVQGVTPAKLKPLDEVKTEVKTLWTNSERARQLSDLAGKLIERAEKGEPLAKLASEVGGKLETAAPFTRASVPQGLSERASQLAFALGKGKMASAESVKPGSRTVFKVTEITLPPPATAEQRDKLTRELTRQLQNDVVVEYVSALQDRLGVTINEPAIRRVLGIEQQ